MKKKRYSIGELSRLCNVSTKALRFYDSLGLISSLRNGENNYRTYTHDDLLTVLILKYYKQMGFKLEEMKEFLSGTEGGATENMRVAFDRKIAELQKAQAELRHCEQSVLDWNALITEAMLVREADAREVSVKYVEPRVFLFQDQTFDGDIKSSIINVEFANYVEKTGNAITGPVYIQYASLEDRIARVPQSMRIMQDFLRPGGEGNFTTFGGCMMASCYHIGPLESIPQTYPRICQWADRHGYSIGTDCCERYIADYWTGENTHLHVAELRVKVQRKDLTQLTHKGRI
ncbi:MAG: MerR family transcriptional regulator [Mailhella sp.]|nr:MerR family transcriptional regulator [Mailhella sp.]